MNDDPKRSLRYLLDLWPIWSFGILWVIVMIAVL